VLIRFTEFQAEEDKYAVFNSIGLGTKGGSMRKNVFYVFLGAVLIIVFLASCSDSSTGPEEEDVEFVRDFHLIVSSGEGILEYLPDTLAYIDSAIAILNVAQAGAAGIDPDTADIMHTCTKGYILKADLGSANEEREVTDPGEKIFSIAYPKDLPWGEQAAIADIEIFVRPLDTTYYFEDGRIGTFFSIFYGADTTVEHGIQTKIYNYGSVIEIAPSAGTGYSIRN